jgi:hypothetical protein
VTFHVPDVPLGVLVDGSPIIQKPGDPIRLALAGPTVKGRDERQLALRPSAWETLGDARYPILLGSIATDWSGIELAQLTSDPIEVQAEGFLVLADNRDEGACCDSRALGWIAPEHLRGEVVLRLAGDPNAMPEGDPATRGMQWLP